MLEVALYAALILLIGGPLVSIVLVSTRSTKENDTVNAVTERNRTVLLRVEKDLRRSIASTASVADLGRALVFTTPAGFDGAAIVPGESVRVELRPSAGETFNGKDDDGDGLVDDGDLVRRNASTGQETLLAQGVDLNTSLFSEVGTGFTLQLTSFGSVPGGRPFSVSKSVTVYPRN